VAVLTLTIEPDEFLGLSALVELGRTAEAGHPDATAGETAMVIVLMAGWIITVIGGYALQWTWTGYPGNTLWDWLEMLLVPLVFPTILLPFLLKWISGNAAEQAAMAPTATTAAGAKPAGALRVRVLREARLRHHFGVDGHGGLGQARQQRR
jgi:hypothetical protein